MVAQNAKRAKVEAVGPLQTWAENLNNLTFVTSHTGQARFSVAGTTRGCERRETGYPTQHGAVWKLRLSCTWGGEGPTPVTWLCSRGFSLTPSTATQTLGKAGSPQGPPPAYPFLIKTPPRDRLSMLIAVTCPSGHWLAPAVPGSSSGHLGRNFQTPQQHVGKGEAPEQERTGCLPGSHMSGSPRRLDASGNAKQPRNEQFGHFLFSYPLSLLHLGLPLTVPYKPSSDSEGRRASSAPGAVLWPGGRLTAARGPPAGSQHAPLALGALSSLLRPVTHGPSPRVLPAPLVITTPAL